MYSPGGSRCGLSLTVEYMEARRDRSQVAVIPLRLSATQRSANDVEAKRAQYSSTQTNSASTSWHGLTIGEAS